MTPRVKFLTTTEAAARLDVSAEAVRQWLEAGRLTGYRTPGGDRRGGQWRIDPASVDAVLGESARKRKGE